LTNITCNDVVTPYPVLVDMSGVVDDMPGELMNDGATLYKISMLSIERLMFVYVGPVIKEGTLNKRIEVRVE